MEETSSAPAGHGIQIDLHSSFTAAPLKAPLDFWYHKIGVSPLVRVVPPILVEQAMISAAADEDGRNLIMLLRWEDWVRQVAVRTTMRQRVTLLRRRLADYIGALERAVSVGRCSVTTYVCPASAEFVAIDHMDTLRDELFCTLTRSCGSIPRAVVVDLDGLGAAFGLYGIDDPYADHLGHIPYRHEFFPVLAAVIVGGIATQSDPRSYLLADMAVVGQGPDPAQLLNAVRPGARLGVICDEPCETSYARHPALRILHVRGALDIFQATSGVSAEPVSRIFRSGLLSARDTVYLAPNPAARDAVELLCAGVVGLTRLAEPRSAAAFWQYPWPVSTGRAAVDPPAAGGAATPHVEPDRLRNITERFSHADQINTEYHKWRRTVQGQRVMPEI